MVSENKYYLSGRKKFEEQDFEGALLDYTKSIEEEENPSVYSERGVVYYYLNRLDLSLKDMNHAASLEPDNPYRYSSRAFIRDAMGDLEGAITDYEHAVKLDPEDSIAYNNLGLLQEKMGYQQKAKTNFSKADKLAEVDQLLNRIREEQRALNLTDHNPTNTKEGDERKQLSLLALLRDTFTTKSGFKAYLEFIKNGFKA